MAGFSFIGLWKVRRLNGEPPLEKRLPHPPQLACGLSRRSAHVEVLHGRSGCSHYLRDGCIKHLFHGGASDGDD